MTETVKEPDLQTMTAVGKILVTDDSTALLLGLLDDIVRDLHEVIVSLCARLYGKRSAKNRAKRAREAATGERQHE